MLQTHRGDAHLSRQPTCPPAVQINPLDSTACCISDHEEPLKWLYLVSLWVHVWSLTSAETVLQKSRQFYGWKHCFVFLFFKLLDKSFIFTTCCFCDVLVRNGMFNLHQKKFKSLRDHKHVTVKHWHFHSTPCTFTNKNICVFYINFAQQKPWWCEMLCLGVFAFKTAASVCFLEYLHRPHNKMTILRWKFLKYFCSILTFNVKLLTWKREYRCFCTNSFLQCVC